MKKSLFAIATALVMGSGILSAYAVEPTPSQNITTNDKIGYDWTAIQTVFGISVSYATVEIGEERFLSIKFENTTSESTDFIWSMTKNDQSIVITQDEMIESIVQLDANGSFVHDGIYLIEMSEEDQLSDFIVSIQPTKR